MAAHFEEVPQRGTKELRHREPKELALGTQATSSHAKEQPVREGLGEEERDL